MKEQFIFLMVKIKIHIRNQQIDYGHGGVRVAWEPVEASVMVSSRPEFESRPWPRYL